MNTTSSNPKTDCSTLFIGNSHKKNLKANNLKVETSLVCQMDTCTPHTNALLDYVTPQQYVLGLQYILYDTLVNKI